MHTHIIILLAFLFSLPGLCVAQQVEAKRPYHDIIYECNKKKITFAVDKLRLTRLESCLTQKWVDRINPKIVNDNNRDFLYHFAATYDIRIKNVKKHFDIKFVDWMDYRLTEKPAFRVGSRDWIILPKGDFESTTWVLFMEWLVHEWDYPNSLQRWKDLTWEISSDYYSTQFAKRKKFVFDLIDKNPRYVIGGPHIFRIPPLLRPARNFYFVYDIQNMKLVHVSELGHKDDKFPTMPAQPMIKICPLDKNFIINKEIVDIF